MDDNLVFAENMIGKDPEGLKLQFYDQLKNFRRAHKTPNDPAFGRAQVSYTGKGHNAKDDLLLAAMMALYYSGVTRDSVRFNNEAFRNGWLVNRT